MTAERWVLLTPLRPRQPEVVLEKVDHHCVILVGACRHRLHGNCRSWSVVTCCGLFRLGRHHCDISIESGFVRLGREKGSGHDVSGPGVGALRSSTGTGCASWWLLELEWRGQVQCWALDAGQMYLIHLFSSPWGARNAG